MSAPTDPLHTCERCGALTFGAGCGCAQPQPAGAAEVLRLFEPVRTMPGQLAIDQGTAAPF